MGFSLLLRRQATYYFRRAVPVALRPIIGQREILVSLRTKDLQEAKSRAAQEAVKADRLLWQARQTLQNPSAAVHTIAQRIVKEDAQARLGKLQDDDDELEAESLALMDELERLAEKKPARLRDGSVSLRDAIQVRARIQALQTVLKRLQSGGAAVPEDPPLSVVFDRWRTERKPSEKTWREFDLSLRRFIEVNGDLSVRSITKNHVRAMKTALLGMKSSKPRGKNETLSAASVAKLLNGTRAVLEWATREGYIDANPAHGVSRVAALATKNGDQEDRRLPFSVEQAKAIMTKLPAEGDLRYVTLISLYSGAPTCSPTLIHSG